MDKYMYAIGILHKAKLTHSEMCYGRACVGDSFEFEVILQYRAYQLIKGKKLSDEKRKSRISALAELVVKHIRGEKIVRGKKENTADDYAQVMGCHRDTWYQYKQAYKDLCEWCNDLESDANMKVWQVLDKEQEKTK